MKLTGEVFGDCVQLHEGMDGRRITATSIWVAGMGDQSRKFLLVLLLTYDQTEHPVEAVP